jgi:hypothetical protein
LTYANNLFVALGSANTALTSDDGVNWNAHDLATTNRLSGLAYGDGQFVAVGSYGTILTSSNGLNWVLQASGTTNDLGPVAYGNGRFMALTSDARTAVNTGVVVSTNGRDWEWKSVPAIYLAFGFTYGNGLFVVVGGQLGGTTINVSPDGAVWTSRLSGTTNGQSGAAYGVAFGNGVFVVAGENRDQNGTFGTLLNSTNAIDWNYTRTQSRLFGLTYVGGVFIAEQESKIVTSVDGVHWISRASPFPASYFVFANNAFVAAGGHGALLRSASASTTLLPGLRGATGDFSMSLVGLLGFNYRVQVSGDLTTWNDLQSFTNIQSAVSVVDTNASLCPKRFYRAGR